MRTLTEGIMLSWHRLRDVIVSIEVSRMGSLWQNSLVVVLVVVVAAVHALASAWRCLIVRPLGHGHEWILALARSRLLHVDLQLTLSRLRLDVIGLEKETVGARVVRQ